MQPTQPSGGCNPSESTSQSIPAEKVCCDCAQSKSLEAFYRHRGRIDGRQDTCKACQGIRYAAYYSENKALVNERSRRNMQKKRTEDPTYTARARLRHLYRMTLEDYAAKLAAQGGGCAICAKPPGDKRLHVDHDHDCCPGSNARTCGRCIRDLLCDGCNNGTGIADNPELLRKRADYVERWRARRLGITQAA